MNLQVNWQKIRSELNRLSNVDELKSEVHRIGAELRKFDYHTVLSPTAQAKVKIFEKRYAELMKTLHQAQRQVDREFNRIVRQLKVQRQDVQKVVSDQRAKLEKLSVDFRKRFAKAQGATTASAKPARKTTVRRSKAPSAPRRKTRKA